MISRACSFDWLKSVDLLSETAAPCLQSSLFGLLPSNLRTDSSPTKKIYFSSQLVLPGYNLQNSFKVEYRSLDL